MKVTITLKYETDYSITEESAEFDIQEPSNIFCESEEEEKEAYLGTVQKASEMARGLFSAMLGTVVAQEKN
jgi:hypothetical protein